MKGLEEFIEMITSPRGDKLMRKLDYDLSKALSFKSISWTNDTCLAMNLYFKQYILGVATDSKSNRIEAMNKIKGLSKELKDVLLHFKKEYNNCKKNHNHKEEYEKCDK